VSSRAERLVGLFRAEARERLAELTAGALRVEAGECPSGAADALFRAAHTIKGGAAMLGLDPPAEAAGELEELLRPLRDGRIEAGPALGAAMLAAIDSLTAAIWPPAEAAAASSELSPEAARGARGTAVAGDTTVRVAAERIDAVVGLVGEALRASASASPRDLADILATAEEAALRLRLVALAGIVPPLERAVRDAARMDGKQAGLVVTGAEVEADAAVVDVAAEVVLQLARNAVAHGIEPPERRAEAGKPGVGRIELDVASRGGWLRLRVADDGGGVDVEALRARPAARGLDSAASAMELLFAPGLSTREQSDRLGGQGVGLDVVRERVRAAGGRIRVAWVAGRGSSFEVDLPVSTLYERLLIGELDGALVGLPADAVEMVMAAEGEGAPVLADGTLTFETLPEEVNVLTVPLGPLLAPCRLARRAWIGRDGRVGVVLDAEALGGLVD
jgi:two-component system chemotaxis sensor kinase CheA